MPTCRIISLPNSGDADEAAALASVEEHRLRRQLAAVEAAGRGQQALFDGDVVEAERWLDRARRIAGGNDTIELLLAGLRLRRGDAAAAALGFAEIAVRHDLREAWIGLATARRRLGQIGDAAVALGTLLSGHAGPVADTLRDLADTVAADAGLPGWCGLAPGRRLVLGGAVSPVLELDGLRLPDIAAAGAIPPGRRLVVRQAGQDLLGSPLRLDRMSRLEGFCAAADGAIAGWAWHPNDPSTPPALRLIAADGRVLQPVLLPPSDTDAAASQRHDRPLFQPHRFRIEASALPVEGPFRLVGADGRDLPGSPADPGGAQRYARAVADAVADAVAGKPAADALRDAPVPAAVVGVHRASPRRRGRPPATAVIVPVYGGGAVTLACLDSVFAHTDGARVIVVDDAGPEPELAAALDRLAAARRITLIRHARNLGFPAAANAGLRAAGQADAVLLNSDTLVPPGWLPRLRDVAYAAADIGTVTPFSNDATLVSYPRQAGGNAVPDAVRTRWLDRLAARANGGAAIDIPTAVGFCMFIRRDCLDQVGFFREDAFAQGYGEENDFCLRARHLGFRHLAAPGVFVAHVGGQSFGVARTQLLARNLAVLNRLHPGYDALIAADSFGPELAAARRRLDLAVLGRRRLPASSVILITHDVGGGVERQVQVRGDALRAQGLLPILLRPVLARPLLRGTGKVSVAFDAELPNLIYDVAAELPALLKLLAARRPRLVELHHMLGHPPALTGLAAQLGVPLEIHVHDYAWFCPRVTLVGFERRYCGEPDIAGCEACIADSGRNIDEDIPVAALVTRSAAEFAAAAKIVAPSADVAHRLQRHFPSIRPVVQPWDDARPIRVARPVPAARPPAATRTVGVLGAIGIEKGYDVLLACARDAAARRLQLRFVVIGHTTDDARLLDTGAVFITGEYRPEELARLIADHAISLGFLPSIWPETWCFTLSEAWRAGLCVLAFDIGAPAERIRQHGGGVLLPLGCRAPQINAALLAAKVN